LATQTTVFFGIGSFKKHSLLLWAYLRQGGIAHDIALARATHGHTAAYPYFAIFGYSIGTNDFHKGHIHIGRGFYLKEDAIPIGYF